MIERNIVINDGKITDFTTDVPSTDKKIKGNLAVRSGLFYNGLGQRFTVSDKEQQEEFNYFTVPLQAKLSFKGKLLHDSQVTKSPNH